MEKPLSRLIQEAVDAVGHSLEDRLGVFYREIRNAVMGLQPEFLSQRREIDSSAPSIDGSIVEVHVTFKHKKEFQLWIGADHDEVFFKAKDGKKYQVGTIDQYDHEVLMNAIVWFYHAAMTNREIPDALRIDQFE